MRFYFSNLHYLYYYGAKSFNVNNNLLKLSWRDTFLEAYKIIMSRAIDGLDLFSDNGENYAINGLNLIIIKTNAK